MKRFLGVLCSLTLLLVSSTGIAAAKEEQTKPPKAVTEYSQAIDSINKQISEKHQKRKSINLNRVEKEEYTYQYDDGSVTSITIFSVDVAKGDEDKVSFDSDGSIKLAESLASQKSNNLVAAAATPVTTVKSGVVKTTWELTFWQQKIFGSWTYTPGVNGSLTEAKHTSDPSVTSGMGVTAETPKPYVNILSGKNAAHIGSTCRFTVKGPKDVTAWTTDQKAVLIVDINGNYRFVDDTN